jgi:hypothetical protein
MTKKEILKYALLNASLTSLYIALIGFFFRYGTIFLNSRGKSDTVFAPIAMLLLFVFSASLCGALVLGRPILWYMDGKKKEAVILFIYTLTSFLVITGIMFVLLFTFD